MNLSNANRRRGLFVLAIVLLLGSVASLLMGHPLGTVLCIPSVYLVRMSRVHSPAGATETRSAGIEVSRLSRPGRNLWVGSGVLAAAWGVSWILVVRDFNHGGHQGWPVIVFAGLGLVCITVWSYVLALIMQ